MQTERLREFQDALVAIPGIEVTSLRAGKGDRRASSDALVAISVNGRDFVLEVETKKTVFPRDVKQVLGQIMGMPDPPPGSLHVVIAESVSPGARELFQRRGIGYWDSGGSLFLVASGLFVLIDRAIPKTLERAQRSLFTGRRAQAILAMLEVADEWVNVREISAKSGVSRPTISQVMTDLEARGLVETRGAGPNKQRRVSSPGELLDAWSSAQASKRKIAPRRFFVPGSKGDALAAELARELERRGVSYGLCGQAAAQRYSPFLSSYSVVSIRVLESPAVSEALESLGAREVDEGANLEVITTRSEDDFTHRERVGDAWLLCPIQVYLDLVRDKGRSPELAEHLRRERIGF